MASSDVRSPRDSKQTPSPEKRAKPDSELMNQGFSKVLVRFCKSFKRWDLDGGGDISLAEFKYALRDLHIPHAENALLAEQLFNHIDHDQSGGVTKYEAVRYLVLDRLQASTTRLYNQFKLWDIDCSGTVDLDEWKLAIEAFGLDVPMQYVEQLFHELDEAGTGELVYEELSKRLRGPKGRVVSEICEASPKLASPNKTNRWPLHVETPSATNTPPLHVTMAARPGSAAAGANTNIGPRSSSRPPSPSAASDAGSSDNEEESRTAEEVLSDALELAQYLKSDRLERAKLEHDEWHAAEQARRLAEAAEKACSRRWNRFDGAWPYYARYPPTMASPR